jgi:putative hydroxymethylpyrimidine transporter CytX
MSGAPTGGATGDGPGAPGTSEVEAPLVLDLGQAPPRPLGLLDQTILWLSMGASLLVAAAAVFVLYPVAGAPPLALPAALTVVVVGVACGTGLLALAGVAGARTGAPAMALLRGLLGTRTSYLPTALNLLQCFGWAAVEVFVISTVATSLTGPGWRPLWVVLAGGMATAMAIRPLGMVRVIRRYLGWLVLASVVVLLVGLLREGVHSPEGGDWSGFWVAFDVVVALPISWVPLVSDFTRYARTPRVAAAGVLVGYAVSCATFFLLGLLSLLTLSSLGDAGTPTAFSLGLVGLPLGTLALVVLLCDEVDKAFANIYSTTMSAQNVVQRIDRRWLASGFGALATLAALVADLEQYESFLFLIGAVFVPLAVVLVTDFYLVRALTYGRVGAGYDVREPGRNRWLLVLPWAVGFVAYQLVNPGLVAGWTDWWLDLRVALGLQPPGWLSASVAAAVAAFVATLVVAVPLAVRARRR